MNNLTDLCITLAEKLGWKVVPNKVLGDIIYIAGQKPFSMDVDSDLIFAFIAHAKAELAKRGCLAKCNYDSLRFHSNEKSEYTDWHFLDPTNPLSTAEAKLKAMIEALS